MNFCKEVQPIVYCLVLTSNILTILVSITTVGCIFAFKLSKLFVMNEKVKYWAELSEYDYDTALAMMQTGRYLYVGFMCHQTIEKILKAYFNAFNTEPAPFTHSLTYLANKANIYDILPEELKDFIDILEPLNIEARYPSHKERLMKSLTKERCQSILRNTKDLQTWITEKL